MVKAERKKMVDLFGLSNSEHRTIIEDVDEEGSGHPSFILGRFA
jgi:hypothetical protein